MTKTFKYATCKNCGNTHVTWLQSKTGNWYLADVNSGIRGSQYTSPHFQTCTAVGPKADQLRATAEHNAKVEADRAAEAVKSAEINARMLDMIKAGMTSEEIVAAIYGEYNQEGK
jgi:hypothetical protein